MLDRLNTLLADRFTPRNRTKTVPVLVLFSVLIIIGTLFILFGSDPEAIARFKRYGYPGAFLVSLIGNASVFLFMGTVLPVLVSIGGLIYPAAGVAGLVGVGLAGGVGAAIGEIAGYLIGYSGRGIAEKSEKYRRIAGRLRKRGALGVFLLSLVPFVFDVVAIAAGALRIPLWQFVIACWAGRTILYVGSVVVLVLGWDVLIA